jgi:hypothetical protein
MRKRDKVLLEKLIVIQLARRFSAVYGNQKFIAIIIVTTLEPQSEPAESNPINLTVFPYVICNIILPFMYMFL